jgi:hypothetical protein
MCRYASLAEGLPKDDPKRSRRQILAEGGGITLFQIAAKAAKLGKCTCAGRESAVRAAVPDHFDFSEL